MMTKNYEARFREAEAAREAIKRLKIEQCLARIREDLIHGYHPRRDDLLDWWEAFTGERITNGTKCGQCEGTGTARYETRDELKIEERQACRACGGLGWDVLPTAWERIADDRD